MPELAYVVAWLVTSSAHVSPGFLPMIRQIGLGQCPLSHNRRYDSVTTPMSPHEASFFGSYFRTDDVWFIHNAASGHGQSSERLHFRWEAIPASGLRHIRRRVL